MGKAKRARKSSRQQNQQDDSISDANNSSSGGGGVGSTSLLTYVKQLCESLQKLPIPKLTTISDKHPVCQFLLVHNNNNTKTNNSNSNTSSNINWKDPTALYICTIVLAVETLQLLLPIIQNDNDNENIVAVATMLAWSLSKSLPKKVVHNRLLIGRAFLVVSTAAIQALPVLLNNNNNYELIQAAIQTLQTVVNPETVTTTSNSIFSWPDKLKGTKKNIDWSKHQACLDAITTAADAALIDEMDEDDESSSKNNNNDNNNKVELSTAITSSFKALQLKEHAMDGRLAVKRWTSINLTWYCQGQRVLLETANQILQREVDNDETFAEQIKTIQVPNTDIDNNNKNKNNKEGTPTSSNNNNNNNTKIVKVQVPSNVVVMDYVCRLCDLVCEINEQAGTRPPNSINIDTYMQVLLDTKPKKAKSDVRDLALNVLYNTIQFHQQHCLNENFTKAAVVNDDSKRPFETTTTKNVADIPTADESYQKLYLFYPKVHKSIANLSNLVNAKTISAAWSLQALDDDNYFIVDALQTNWALAQLTSCLTPNPATTSPDSAISSLVAATMTSSSTPRNSSSSSSKKNTAAAAASPYKLNQALVPPPLLSSSSSPVPKKRKRKKESESGSSRPTALKADTPDEQLALFLRARSDWVDFLLELIRLCCFMNSSMKSKKRKATTTTSRSSKRRKRSINSKRNKDSDDGNEIINDETAQETTESSESLVRPIQGLRSIVATKALETLQLFFRKDDNNLSPLQSMLRSKVTLDQIKDIIDLNLDQIILRTREQQLIIKMKKQKSESDDNKDSNNNKNDNTTCEKYLPDEMNSLWTALIEMCTTLGRGRLQFNVLHSVVLGEEDRLEMYKYISEKYKSSSWKGSWPLCLSAAHRAILSSSLSNEHIMPDASSDSDLLIVRGFIESLSAVLDDSDIALPKIENDAGSLRSSENIPVSLHDARIFLSAFSRLIPSDQIAMMTILLAPIKTVMEKLKDSKVAKELIIRNVELPSFLARVLTLCVDAEVLILFGTPARNNLDRILGNAAHIPAFRSLSDWHYPERCFMGTFLGWEESELPKMDAVVKDPDIETVSTLQNILMNGLALGFLSAPYDKCHLLFASWNALGKSDLWNELQTGIASFTELPSNLASLIIELRNDVCFVDRNMRRLNLRKSSDSSSTLLKVIEEKAKASNTGLSRSTDVKALLQAMLSKALQIVDKLLDCYVPSDATMYQEVSSEVFSLLETLSVYICFAISCFTQPGMDYYEKTLSAVTDRSRSRARGYSTDSERMQSENGSVDSQDILADTLERIQDVCEHLGAAPSHPDWLDKQCQLQDGISYRDALEAAQSAQIILSKLVDIGLAQCFLMESRAFALLKRQDADDQVKNEATLASMLCWLNFYETENSTAFGRGPYADGKREYKYDISTICDVDPNVVDLLLSEAAGSHRPEARSSWCPRSAQRILGQFQNSFKNQFASEAESPELRAAGEWEVLLAGSLVSAVVHVEQARRSVDHDESVYDAVGKAERWSGVAWSAVDSLVPVSALLRYGLLTGGRISHPLFSLNISTDEFISNKSSIVQEIPKEKSVTESLHRVIIGTLASVSRFPSNNPTCDAVATHLLKNVESFEILQGIHASSTAVQIFSELKKNVFKKGTKLGATPFLLEKLFAVIDVRNPFSGRRFDGLFSCLSDTSVVRKINIDTIATEKMDARHIFSVSQSIHNNCIRVPIQLDLSSSREIPIPSFVEIIWHDLFQATTRSKSFVACLLAAFVDIHYAHHHSNINGNKVLSVLAKSFNQIPDKRLVLLVENDISRKKGCERELPEEEKLLKDALCVLMAYLIVPLENGTKFHNHGLILNTLEQDFEIWKETERENRASIMNLVIMYAIISNNLYEIGSRLIKDLKAKQKVKDNDQHSFENLKIFADCMEEIQRNSMHLPQASTQEQNQGSSLKVKLPSTCSYAVRKDFHEQHWYNCYTCGLTADKGCCTLCALVCHQGHDVAYARYSSFFCDCGGEDDYSVSEKPKKCKCLSGNALDSFLRLTAEQDANKSVIKTSPSIPLLTNLKCGEILKNSFVQDGKRSVELLSEKAKSDAWVRFLFECTKRKFEKWRSQSHGYFSLKKNDIKSYRAARKHLESAVEDGQRILKLEEKGDCIALSSSRSGTFQTKISSDSSLDRQKRVFLSRFCVIRSIMDSDTRGRIVIVEPSGLVFFTPFPIVNGKLADKADETVPSRSSMCILNTVSVDICAVGVRFFRDDERFLVVWGLDEAKVVCLTENLTSLDFCASLKLDFLKNDESKDNFVVNCHWLEGSQSCIAVGSRKKLRIFELSGCSYVDTLTLSFETFVRDFCIIRIPLHGNEALYKGMAYVWKVFLLLDNGELQEKKIASSLSGEINELNNPETDKSLSVFDFSTMSTTSGSTLIENIETNKGSLTFLRQSNLLIFQCPLAGARAILLDENGTVKGSFLLLPPSVPITEGDSDVFASGPYGNWRELGILCCDNLVYFRICCTARLSQTDEPVILVIQFNGSEIRVQDCSRSSGGWYDPPQSIEGLCAFSAPFERETNKSTALKNFGERLFLCSLPLNGCLQIFSDQYSAPVVNAIESCGLNLIEDCGGNEDERAFQILDFERLKNLTDSTDLQIRSDSFREEELKAKLIGESESFLVSPRREGFCLFLSLRQKEFDFPSDGLQFRGSKVTCKPLAISAVRVLVGSTSRELLPRCLKVMGRCIEVVPELKRWYTFQLNVRELALSIRNGFLTIEVDRCFDSTANAVVDAIEVYGIELSEIDRSLPFILRTEIALPLSAVATDKNRVSGSESFGQSLLALASMKNLLGNFKPNRSERLLLRQLVQESALGTDVDVYKAVIRLVESVAHDEETRQAMIDKAVLSGFSAFLSKCQRQVEELRGVKDDERLKRMWVSLVPKLRTCLQTAKKIARLRPFNYLKAADEKSNAFGSVAADAGNLIAGCLHESLLSAGLVSDYVDLSLLETAVANGSPRGRFGSFEGLRTLLSCSNLAIVTTASSCISCFCRSRDIFVQTMSVEFLCDSCLKCITQTRYTFSEDDQSFDLCPECYSLGKEFVASQGVNQGDYVTIKGKTVGETPKLTCGLFSKLHAIEIQKLTMDNIRDKKKSESSSTTGNETSTLENIRQNDRVSQLLHREELVNDFMDGLFAGIADLLGDQLTGKPNPPMSLVFLCVDLIRHSFDSGKNVDRAKRLTDSLAIALKLSLESTGEDGNLEAYSLIALEGLNCLLCPDDDARSFLCGVQENVITDKSVEKDGSEHVCSGKSSEKPATFKVKGEVSEYVWGLLEEPSRDGHRSTLSKICCAIENFLTRWTLKADGPLFNTKSPKTLSSADFESQINIASGSLCSSERILGQLSTRGTLQRTAISSFLTQSGQYYFVERALHLIVLAGRHGKDVSQWYPVLCRIILDINQNETGSLKVLAKKALQKVCGDDSVKSTAILNHFSFAFEFDKLLRIAEPLAQRIVILIEKARQNHHAWHTFTKRNFCDLNLSHIIGTDHLVTEDINSFRRNDSISKILDALISASNKHGSSIGWRQFCGLRVSNVDNSMKGWNESVSPIFALFAIACATAPENQVKTLKLINLALTKPNERKGIMRSASEKAAGEGKKDIVYREDPCLKHLYLGGSTPEESILVSVDDVYAFVVRFLCHGSTAEVRNISSSLAFKLSKKLDKNSLEMLFRRLMTAPLHRAGYDGKVAAEFLTFLSSLLRLLASRSVDTASFAGVVESHFRQQLQAIRHDKTNMNFLSLETRSGSSVQKRRFDLAKCMHCGLSPPRVKLSSSEKGSGSQRSSSSLLASRPASGTRSGSNKATKWLPEQVSPYTRFRLEVGKETCVSNEFSLFFSLKNRLAVSAFHMEVENPRRFVKTIKCYFTARPVEDASVLKSDSYAENWQLCGTLNLSRGASRASLNLSTPVLAANLRIEYSDFYERSGSTKTSDGSLIVHCPRCTRVVTNAHGVCASCGEVAFQCRKCRHINYDRLDAFFCVECGYCASGTFQHEITGGIASNAIVITNDREFSRLTQMAAAAENLYRDLRSALRQKLTLLSRGRKGAASVNEGENIFGWNASLQRAFEGSSPLGPGESEEDQDFTKLSLNNLGKPGSVVKIIARSHKGSTTKNRALSLFRASRTMRSDSASSRPEGLMIRGLHADGDEDETASEILGGLLDSSGGLSRYASSLDAGDSLGRLLAQVQSRREQRRTTEEQEGQQNNNKEKPGGSFKASLDTCDRLHILMREAERESIELERRCDAWRRMESGNLEDIDPEDSQHALKVFEPSHCSACAPSVALHLLVLWLRLFQHDPESIVITKDLLNLFFIDDGTTSHWKSLQDTKRLAVKEIAIRSKQGRPLVLEALRTRLTLLHDVASAEILGKILEGFGSDKEAAAPFLQLARDAMETVAGL